MDTADLSSDCSYNSDSLHSSLSGLSVYQDEYTELLHLVNSPRYPEPQTQLPQGEVVQELVHRNQELELKLAKANKQINRLVNCHNKLQVEREVQGLWDCNSKLRESNTKLQKEKQDLEAECQSMRVSLAELKTEKHVDKTLIASLKQKVSQHYIDWQQEVNCSAGLRVTVSDLTARLQEADRVKLRYQTLFDQCRNTQTKLHTTQTEVDFLREENSKLQLEVTQIKSELDKVQLEALKEKSQLLHKVEQSTLEFTPQKPSISLTTCQNCHSSEEVLLSLETQVTSKNIEIARLVEELSSLTSKCAVLEATLGHKEREIEGLQLRQKDLNLRLESERVKGLQIEPLKARIAALEVELSGQKADKTSVEQQIEVLRTQFVQFKENYSQVKDELNQKNKEKLERATDDQKLKQQNHTKTVLSNVEHYVTGCFDNLNTDEFASDVDIRLKYLDERLRALKDKVGRLEVVDSRVKELEVLLEVRNRDLKQRQLRMDRNNRTLLRKVKEHMKGRNRAEKQLEQLREMYGNVAEERNSLQLTLASLEARNQHLQAEKEDVDKLRLELDEARKQVALYSSNLQRTVERLEESKMAEVRHSQLCQQYQQSLKEYQSRASRLESEKYFFQRMSRDLKVALTSYNCVKGNNNFIAQYDEESVRQLLADSKEVSCKWTAPLDVKRGLDQLRDEICNLQDQIVRESERC